MVAWSGGSTTNLTPLGWWLPPIYASSVKLIQVPSFKLLFTNFEPSQLFLTWIHRYQFSRLSFIDLTNASDRWSRSNIGRWHVSKGRTTLLIRLWRRNVQDKCMRVCVRASAKSAWIQWMLNALAPDCYLHGRARMYSSDEGRSLLWNGTV